MGNVNKILVINFGGIGDEIFFLPTLISLKKEFPNSKITLALEPRSKSVKDNCFFYKLASVYLQ